MQAEGGPPGARCPRDARWVLGDRSFVLKEVASSTCNFGTSSNVLSWGFLTSFSRAYAGSFPQAHALTPHRTLVLKQHRPQVRQEGGLSGTALPRDARSARGERGFVGNDVGFLLFGVTTEEIRWLESGVVVPRVTPPPPGAGDSLACARVVPWTFVGILRLWAPAYEG